MMMLVTLPLSEMFRKRCMSTAPHARSTVHLSGAAGAQMPLRPPLSESAYQSRRSCGVARLQFFPFMGVMSDREENALKWTHDNSQPNARFSRSYQHENTQREYQNRNRAAEHDLRNAAQDTRSRNGAEDCAHSGNDNNGPRVHDRPAFASQGSWPPTDGLRQNEP